MKTLCLIRHAKTSWENPTGADFDRPLDERGLLDANALSEFLQNKGLVPELILASPAVRTRHTAEIIANNLTINREKIQFHKQIYGAGVEDLLGVLMELPNEINTVFLVAHNPAVTMLASYLGEHHVASLQTAGACGLQLETDDWKEITTAEAKTLFEYHPPHDI